MPALAATLKFATVAAIIVSLTTVALARDESGAVAFSLGQKATTANFFKSASRDLDVTGSIEMPTLKPRKIKRSRPAVIAPVTAAATATATAEAPATPVGWEAAILGDQSLRRGDVVMFPTGPKVFKGGSTRKAPWTTADFEDLATTKAMANRARDTMLASIGKPADEITKPVAPLAKTASVKDGGDLLVATASLLAD